MTDSQLSRTGAIAEALGCALLESDLAAVIAIDRQGRIVEWGGGAEAMFGHRAEDLRGRELAEVVVPAELRATHRAGVARASERPQRVLRRFEQLAVRADGSEFPVDVTIMGTPGPLFLALVWDVSERRRAEFRLARSEALLAEAEELAKAGSFESDLRTGEAKWSTGMYRAFGLPVGSPPPRLEAAARLLHAGDRARAVAEIERVVRERPPLFEFRWRMAGDGEAERVVAMRGKVVLDELGQATRLVGTVRDVSEEWRAHQTRDLLAYVVQSSDDAIFTKRADGTITSWNAGAERLYGYAAAEAIGRPVTVLAPPHRRGEQVELTRRVFAGESIRHQEAERVRKDGTQLVLSLTISPVRDPAGRIVSAAVMGRDVTERRQLERRLRHLADHDPLTGLVNRRRFESELQRELARVDRHGGSGAILSLDLDNFKAVNDAHGHAAGDALLCAVARTLEQVLRESDVAARFGGDEFAVLLPATDVEDARTVGGHLLAALREVTVEADSSPVSTTASIGGVGFREQDLEVDELLAGADLAMYRAKEDGRDRVVIFNDAPGRGPQSDPPVSWSRRIREALEHDRLVLLWQPIVSLTSGRPAGGELLLRMRRGEELVEPGAFLGTAERLGLIGDIDRWVVRRAIALAAAGRTPDGLPVSINLSAASVADDPGLLELIAAELAAHDVHPSRLGFEIAETAVVANLEAIRSFARGLRELGCRLGLDDFGAGFGSFLPLRQLPIDFIKIEHSFIRHLAGSTVDQRLVRAMADVARGLEITTIAEAVSDSGTLGLLREMGVEHGQGFLFGPPRALD